MLLSAKKTILKSNNFFLVSILFLGSILLFGNIFLLKNAFKDYYSTPQSTPFPNKIMDTSKSAFVIFN